MNNTLKKLLVLLFVSIAFNAYAEISADEIAKLDNELTPLGGKRAGNAEGTIPAWDGGLTQPPAGFKKGGHYIDPFPDDVIQFTITNSNVSEYADKLSEGHKALLKIYPESFKLNVYQTRRTAAAPQRIYDATKRIARTAKLTSDGNGVTGAIEGIPFPVPAKGLEVIWNHILRWRTNSAERHIAQATPTRGGDYTLVKFIDQFNVLYSQEGMTEEKMNNVMLHYKQEVIAPARLAGGILLVHETLDQR